MTFSLAIAAFIPATQATELVHSPVNPVFGGSPLNGSVLLNNAQAENKKKEPVKTASGSALGDFNAALQRAVLTRLSTAATAGLFDSSGRLVPGNIETGDFRITIVDSGGGLLTITTVDKLTGASTSFQISQQ